MAIKAERSFWATQVFLISENLITILKNDCYDFANHFVIRTYCEDDISRKYNSFSDLLEYSNHKGKRIHTIIIYGMSNNDHSLKLQLSNSWPNNVFVEIEGSESFVEEKSKKVNEFLFSAIPWYNIAAKINYFTLFTWLFVVATWSNIIYAIISKALLDNINIIELFNRLSQRPLPNVPFPYGAIAKLTIFPFGAGVFFNILRDRYFPCYYFEIGQSKDEHKFNENIRWVVIIGFFVSFFSSIFAGLFTI